MSGDHKQERLVLVGLLALFCAIGLMLLIVSVFGDGFAGG